MQRNFSYYWGDALHCRCLSSIFRAWIRKIHMPSRSNYSISALSNIPNSLISHRYFGCLNAPPGIFCKLDAWEWFRGHFWPKAALQLSLLSVRLLGPNFWVSNVEYFIGLLSLGWGHNIARLITHAPWSLRHAARLETSWPGQSGYAIWLHTVKNGVLHYTPGALHHTGY